MTNDRLRKALEQIREAVSADYPAVVKLSEIDDIAEAALELPDELSGFSPGPDDSIAMVPYTAPTVEPPAQCTCQPLAQQLSVPFGLTAVAVDPACPVHREPKGAYYTGWHPESAVPIPNCQCPKCNALNRT